MEFLVLDFEKARRDNWSICEIGLVKYSNGLITTLIDEKINPQCEFDQKSPWFTRLHGISESDVKNSLTFNDFYPKLKKLIEGKIVFNYNGSDKSFLEAACRKNELENINVTWIDPKPRIKLIWKNIGKYELEIVAEYFNIDYKPHKASEDAIALAKIIAIASIVKDHSVLEWKNKFLNSSSSNTISNLNDIKNTNSTFDRLNIHEISKEKSSMLDGQTIVCTSFNTSKEKRHFQDIVKALGGKSPGSISKKTTSVLVGENWSETHAPDKYQKVKELSIKDITKEEFINKYFN